MDLNSATSPKPYKRTAAGLDKHAPTESEGGSNERDGGCRSVSANRYQFPRLTWPPRSGSSSEEDFGPVLPASARKKKRRRLPYEKIYVAALPKSTRYYKSLMHKDQVCYTAFSPHTDFLVTSSLDGVVKFWKKVTGGVEFVKEFRAHSGDIISLSISPDGRNLASAGADKTIKLFDVVTFGSQPHPLAVYSRLTIDLRPIDRAHVRGCADVRMLGA